MKRWMTMMIVLVVCAISGTTAGADMSFDVLTNAKKDLVEGRLRWEYDDAWSVGILATYFGDAEDPHEDWGVGLFAKLTVDPNTTIPIVNWFPDVGDWINLPEFISVSTYLIGKMELYPCDSDQDIDLVGTIGAGGQVGPVIFEYVYMIIEGGDSGNPLLSSGPVLYFGLEPIKF